MSFRLREAKLLPKLIGQVESWEQNVGELFRNGDEFVEVHDTIFVCVRLCHDEFCFALHLEAGRKVKECDETCSTAACQLALGTKCGLTSFSSCAI